MTMRPIFEPRWVHMTMSRRFLKQNNPKCIRAVPWCGRAVLTSCRPLVRTCCFGVMPSLVVDALYQRYSVPLCGRAIPLKWFTDRLDGAPNNSLQRLTIRNCRIPNWAAEQYPWVLREYVDNGTGTGLYKALLLL
jgi:hypothetical protein